MTNLRILFQKDPPEVTAKGVDCAVQICFSLVFQVLALIRSFYGTSGFSGTNLSKTHQVNCGIEVLLHTDLGLA